MNKRAVSVALVLALAFFAGGLTFAGAANAEIKLSFNNYFPPTHMASKLTAEFCKEIEKRSKGEVKIQHYPGGQLLKAPKVFDGVVQGIADMGFSNLAYTRGRFPEMEICDLPVGMPSGWVSTQVVNAFYRKYRPKEFNQAHMLFFCACGPNLISTTTKPVRTLADLKGQTLRGTGRIADTVEALGAVSRPIGIGDTYESVKRNVISGVMLPLETMRGFRLGELLKYCTADWQVGNVYTFYAVMNKKKYDSLPPKIKKLFDQVSKEWIEKAAWGWNIIDLEGARFFRKKGGKVIDLSDAEAAKWVAAVQPVIAKYTKDMEAKGIKGSVIKERLSFIKDSVRKFTARQKAKNIQMPTAD
ncbi:MAG: TRAP transporter substrate-binding protein [Desulfarculaceae bacterium]|jgi:TRAP-type C4-dicarboxylate transport system substrate-binding protein